MADRYYIHTAQSGVQGPFFPGQIQRMSPPPEALICLEGSEDWQPLAEHLWDFQEQPPPPTSYQLARGRQSGRHHPHPSYALPVASVRSRVIYILLALVVFGNFGLHNFYAGYFARGLAQLILCVIGGMFFGFLVLPFLWVWILIEVFVVSRDATGNKMY